MRLGGLPVFRDYGREIRAIRDLLCDGISKATKAKHVQSAASAKFPDCRYSQAIHCMYLVVSTRMRPILHYMYGEGKERDEKNRGSSSPTLYRFQQFHIPSPKSCRRKSYAILVANRIPRTKGTKENKRPAATCRHPRFYINQPKEISQSLMFSVRGVFFSASVETACLPALAIAATVV